MKASDVPEMAAFEDSDGDLHLRCPGGSIRFRKGRIAVLYSSEDLENGAFSFFENCYLSKAKIKIKVKK